MWTLRYSNQINISGSMIAVPKSTGVALGDVIVTSLILTDGTRSAAGNSGIFVPLMSGWANTYNTQSYHFNLYKTVVDQNYLNLSSGTNFNFLVSKSGPISVQQMVYIQD